MARKLLILASREPIPDRLLAGILVRQHWETWLVSLYVLLGGDKALEDIVDDHIQWSRQLSESLRMEGDRHQPDSVKKQKKLNYRKMHKRVIELLCEQGEPADGPAGVTGYDVIYRSESLFLDPCKRVYDRQTSGLRRR